MNWSPDVDTLTPSRRQLLTALGGAGIGLLAGCSSQQPQRRSVETSTSAPQAERTEATPDPTPDSTPTPTGAKGSYFVDPVNGKNTNDGRSPTKAFRTLDPLSSGGDYTLRPGDVIKLRATGVIEQEDSFDLYRVKAAAQNPIVIEPYGDGRPVLDFSKVNTSGIRMEGTQYVTLRGLEVRNCRNDAIRVAGTANGEQSAVGCVFEDLEVHHYGLDVDGNEGNGLGFYRESFDHVVRDVVAHHGSTENNSDGFYIGGRDDRFSGGHRFERCVAHTNADDGFDFFRSNIERPSVLTQCVSFNNGTNGGSVKGDGNGFKMGGGWKTGGNRLIRCVAYDNNANGFDNNNATVPNTYDNCTSFRNGGVGYQFTGNTEPDNPVRNCIAYQNVDGHVSRMYNANSVSNTWDLDVHNPGFLSEEPEQPGFLHLTADSPCVNVGIDIGLSFEGDAPDLGAFEFGV